MKKKLLVFTFGALLLALGFATGGPGAAGVPEPMCPNPPLCAAE